MPLLTVTVIENLLDIAEFIKTIYFSVTTENFDFHISRLGDFNFPPLSWHSSRDHNQTIPMVG